MSQTEGTELPEFSERIAGNAGEFRDRLVDFVIGQGIALEFKESIAPALGVSYGGKIALLPGQSSAEEFSTLVHELAHEMLHKADRRTATTKTVRETEAEAVAFVVGKTIGLETGRASADYNLEDPKYSIEQIAAKVGKSPAYCAARVRLTELSAPAVEAFYAEEIGVGHALLLAKLQPAQQEQALANCFREEWSGAGAKAKRILLPVRHLQQWIEHNVLLLLKQAPFTNAMLNLSPLPEAASNAQSAPGTTGCSSPM